MTSENEKLFLMCVEDIFVLSKRGVVVTGRVERGTLTVGDHFELVGFRPTLQMLAMHLEQRSMTCDVIQKGDGAGILLYGLKGNDVECGQVVAKPDTIRPYTRFRGELYLLTQEEGGRQKHDSSRDAYQFFFRATEVKGKLTLPEGGKPVSGGDNICVIVELELPIAMETRLRFTLRLEGQTLGEGVVTEILDT